MQAPPIVPGIQPRNSKLLIPLFFIELNKYEFNTPQPTFTKFSCSSKFFRFLVSLIKVSQMAPSKVYEFVPIQDFSKPWTDAELYAKYGLDEEEIAFIESMIKPMDLEA